MCVCALYISLLFYVRITVNVKGGEGRRRRTEEEKQERKKRERGKKKIKS